MIDIHQNGFILLFLTPFIGLEILTFSGMVSARQLTICLKSFRIIRVWDDRAARETPLKPCQDRSEKGVALAKAEKENGGKKGVEKSVRLL